MGSPEYYKFALMGDFRQIPLSEINYEHYKIIGGSSTEMILMVLWKRFPSLFKIYTRATYEVLYKQALLFKLAGVHPNIIDWHGIVNHLPYIRGTLSVMAKISYKSKYALLQGYGLLGTVEEFFRDPAKYNMKPGKKDYSLVVKISRDVAQGMLFLEKLERSKVWIITRKLRPNTVTIRGDLRAMLVDFSRVESSKDVYCTLYGREEDWMTYSPPEIILHNNPNVTNLKILNTAYVWTFGIFLLSICTGEYRQPLDKLKSDDVVELYREGRDVSIPDECPLAMRKIIRSCLNYNTHKRIGFKEVVERLNSYYNELTNASPTAKLLIPPTAKLLMQPTAKLLIPPTVHSSVRAIYSPISAGSNHYGIIDEYGNLSMAGNNNEYQLGNGTTILSTIPVPLRFPSKIVSISCAEESTGAVTADGKVYLWGLTGALAKTFDVKGPIKRPRLVNHLRDKFAVKIVLSYTYSRHYGVIFRDGTAYLKMVIRRWDKNVMVDGIINISPGIIDISIGYWVAYILTKDGKIYVSGEPHLPANSKYLTRRQKLSIHIGIDNINGETILKPALVPFEKTAQHIASGISNLNVLTTDGELYTMSSYGEDGPNTIYMLNAMNTESPPEGEKKIPDLETALKDSKPRKKSIPGKIVSISNRFNKSAAVTENGELYMWRYSLADGPVLNAPNVKFRKRSPARKPNIIKNPIQVDIGSKVKYLAVGEDFSIAVTEDRVVNYWGINSLKQPAAIKNKWHSNCTNQVDSVTLEGWEQETDYIQIYDRDRRTGKLIEKPACFDRQSFIKVMEGQVFADWVPRPGRTLDVSGHGGEPGNQRFYKTLYLYYIDYPSYLLLKDPSIREYIKELKHSNQRIGNLEGSFGMSRHHGQTPGFNIYAVRPKN